MRIDVNHRRRREQGYILLVLLLFVALLSIGMLALVERIEQQIKRDREEELIHRGVQYSRAIRRFIKVFGRYPSSVAELENTNNIRFLRKRYKDPLTGKEFRFLRMEDVAYLNTPVGVGSNSVASQHQQQAAGATVSGVSQPNADSAEQPAPRQEENPMLPYSGDPSARDVPSPAQEMPPADTNANGSQPATSVSPIVGVASTSNARTIREFHSQNRYSQWLFIYNPATDSGVPVKTPDQPLLNRTAQAGSQGNGEVTEQVATSQNPNPKQTDQ